MCTSCAIAVRVLCGEQWQMLVAGSSVGCWGQRESDGRGLRAGQGRQDTPTNPSPHQPQLTITTNQQSRLKPNADIDGFKSEMYYVKWNTACERVFYPSKGSVTSCQASLLCEFRGLLVKGGCRCLCWVLSWSWYVSAFICHTCDSPGPRNAVM